MSCADQAVGHLLFRVAKNLIGTIEKRRENWPAGKVMSNRAIVATILARAPSSPFRRMELVPIAPSQLQPLAKLILP